MENEPQEAISKLLGLDKELLYGKKVTATWPEIYAEIGRLKEQASRPPQVVKELWPNTNPTPLHYPEKNPNLHYHGTMPCYQNPCFWC